MPRLSRTLSENRKHDKTKDGLTQTESYLPRIHTDTRCDTRSILVRGTPAYTVGEKCQNVGQITHSLKPRDTAPRLIWRRRCILHIVFAFFLVSLPLQWVYYGIFALIQQLEISFLICWLLLLLNSLLFLSRSIPQGR